MRAPVPAGALNLRVHFLSTTSAPVLPIGQFANLRMVFNGVGLHPGGGAMNLRARARSKLLDREQSLKPLTAIHTEERV